MFPCVSKVFNVGADQPYTLLQLATSVAKAMGAELNIKHLVSLFCILLLRGLACLPGLITRSPVRISRPCRTQDARNEVMHAQSEHRKVMPCRSLLHGFCFGG